MKWHLCFTLQEKELYSKPSPSICAATQTSLAAPVLEIHEDKPYLFCCGCSRMDYKNQIPKRHYYYQENFH